MICSRESVVNNLKEKKLSAQMYRSHFDLSLAKRYSNCITMPVIDKAIL